MTSITRRQGLVPGGKDQAAARWVERLQDALDQNRFELYGQPIVDLTSGRLLRHELLLRLVEDGEVIPTGEFLAAAERHGPIEEIDRWVVGRAVEIAASGRAVNVNLARQSIVPGFIEYLQELLAAHDVDPANLAFELGEVDLIEDEEASRDFLWRLDEIGCGVAVDQFGTGPADLTQLRDLPVGYLKLGREFVRDLHRDPENRDAIEAIVKPARQFGSRTIAVGVEDLATLQILEQLGADGAQGFALGRPAPLRELAPSG